MPPQKIDRFLKLMNDRGASDFHLTVGRPPMLRASGSMEPSHVLVSLGIDRDLIHGSLRFSLCETNTEEEVDAVLEVLPDVICRLREDFSTVA
jgi:Tfp pilus assembly pilus retraction ATPase PilT